MSQPDDLSEAGHDRALMRAFELRHPMLAFGLRMVRRRPITGAISALAFLAASFILVNAGVMIEKRVSIWLDINYAIAWEAHDRADALARAEEHRRRKLVAEETTTLAIPAGHHLAIYYQPYFASSETWESLPTITDDDNVVPEARTLSHFTLTGGQQIRLFHFVGDGKRAEATIGGQVYFLVHAMWWSRDEPPSQRRFPADFSDSARLIVCAGGGAEGCEIWGLIKAEDLEAAGLPG
jgi:hypothetical protein